MSVPKHPKSAVNSLPKLTDPNTIQEVFANHLVGINIRDGIVHLTFSVIRPKHNLQTHGNDDENVVTARLALPISTMESLIGGFDHLKTAMQMQVIQTSKPN